MAGSLFVPLRHVSGCARRRSAWRSPGSPSGTATGSTRRPGRRCGSGACCPPPACGSRPTARRCGLPVAIWAAKAAQPLGQSDVGLDHLVLLRRRARGMLTALIATPLLQVLDQSARRCGRRRSPGPPRWTRRCAAWPARYPAEAAGDPPAAAPSRTRPAPRPRPCPTRCASFERLRVDQFAARAVHDAHAGLHLARRPRGRSCCGFRASAPCAARCSRTPA